MPDTLNRTHALFVIRKWAEDIWQGIEPGSISVEWKKTTQRFCVRGVSRIDGNNDLLKVLTEKSIDNHFLSNVPMPDPIEFGYQLLHRTIGNKSERMNNGNEFENYAKMSVVPIDKWLEVYYETFKSRNQNNA